MPKNKIGSFSLIVAVGCALALFGYLSNGATAFDFAGWKHGSPGYEAAYQEAIDEEVPLILYFSTDWCGWCNRLNTMYLESSDVQAALNEILKVDINPDKGSAERKLQMKYGVRGFPSFLVTVPALNMRPGKVHPFRSNGALTTADFVRAINITIERQYSNKAISLVEKKEYDEALHYFSKAQQYYREDPYLQYNLGSAYLAMAKKDRCSDYLDKAEKSYRAALGIQDDHEGAKSDLEKIAQLRAEWGKNGEPASGS